MFVTCIQVKKHDVMKYTGDGEPPSCMITIKPINDEITLSDLECTVILAGVTAPNKLQLTRNVEYSASQLCELLCLSAHALKAYVCVCVCVYLYVCHLHFLETATN